VTTLDNQTAAVNIGQDIPILSSSTITGQGLAQQNVDRRPVGVLLRVTPRITPEGKVLMRVFPEVSSVVPTPVQLGGGLIGTAFNVQQLETTVVAQDGETVILGGLIQQRDNKTENKVPCLGDLPYVGALFRYRTQSRTKTELIMILTPYVIRSQADMDRMLALESSKMDWIKSDVYKVHGPGGLNAVLPGTPATAGLHGVGPGVACDPVVPGLPLPDGTLMAPPLPVPDGAPAGPMILPPPANGIYPPPVPPGGLVPPTGNPPPPGAQVPVSSSGVHQAGPALMPAGYRPPGEEPQSQGKESQRWKLMRRD
jgi:hypothetical protein